MSTMTDAKRREPPYVVYRPNKGYFYGPGAPRERTYQLVHEPDPFREFTPRKTYFKWIRGDNIPR